MPTPDEDAAHILALSQEIAAANTQDLLKEIADHGEANVDALLQAVIDAVPVWQDIPGQEGLNDGR